MPTIMLGDETHALLNAHSKRGGCADTDAVLQLALAALDETRGVDYEDLDADTRAAIEESEAEFAQGLGRPWEEIREELLAKYFTGVV